MRTPKCSGLYSELPERSIRLLLVKPAIIYLEELKTDTGMGMGDNPKDYEKEG